MELNDDTLAFSTLSGMPVIDQSGEGLGRVFEVRAPQHRWYEAQYLGPAYLLAPHDVEHAVFQARFGREPETRSVGRSERHRDEDGLG